ncbi:pentatricopeptide repeat-containing protein At2g13420, mitochondrial [Spinacia oleracea]|uniref:Pentatricopeptide repeat-containing protein At2g13420, mitochondrial n=1 Tax=Spinacia oleracea TaxID=3562 RepID=A0ABM3RSZ5_SPIOL|nr:pentatricopeptide repeat-containing protein At2g13420, mitochondrial-like [Spinacia oleracea]
MIDKGVEHNVVCYNSLINGICQKSSLHLDDRSERTIRATDKVFDEMRDRGIEPDVTTYSILLHRLEGMKLKGICPSVATYTSVVKCLCSCGRLDDAESFFLVCKVNENEVKASGYPTTRPGKVGYPQAGYPVFPGRVTGRLFNYLQMQVPAFSGTRKARYPVLNTPTSRHRVCIEDMETLSV